MGEPLVPMKLDGEGGGRGLIGYVLRDSACHRALPRPLVPPHPFDQPRPLAVVGLPRPLPLDHLHCRSDYY